MLAHDPLGPLAPGRRSGSPPCARLARRGPRPRAASASRRPRRARRRASRRRVRRASESPRLGPVLADREGEEVDRLQVLVDGMALRHGLATLTCAPSCKVPLQKLLVSPTMSTGQILLLGALAGLTIFIGLPMGRLQRHQPGRQGLPQRHRDRDPALPPLGRARRGDRARRDGARTRRTGAASRGSPRWPFAGFALGLLSLVYYDSWMKARRAQGVPRPGRRLGDRARALALRRACRRRAGSRSSSPPGSACTTSPRASRSASRRPRTRSAWPTCW